MPSHPKWVQFARKVLAGNAGDDDVRCHKLHRSVLSKLPDDFDTGGYLKAALAYKSVSSSSKAETLQQAQSTYIAEKRKVLIALAKSVTTNVVKSSMRKAQLQNRAVLKVAKEPSAASLLHAQATTSAQRTVSQQQGHLLQDVSNGFSNPVMAIASGNDNGGMEQISLGEAQFHLRELSCPTPSYSSQGPALSIARLVSGKQDLVGCSLKRPASVVTKRRSQAKKGIVRCDPASDVD